MKPDEEFREEALAMGLARDLEIPYATLANKILRMAKDQGLEKLIPQEYASQITVLPLFIDNEVLSVAVADPRDASLVEELRTVTKMKIQLFVARKSQIVSAIEESYADKRAGGA